MHRRNYMFDHVKCGAHITTVQIMNPFIDWSENLLLETSPSRKNMYTPHD